MEHDIENFDNEWSERKKKFKKNNHHYNWFTVLYIIPRIETVILVCILTFALTSYDIHPIGCLSSIGVSYDEASLSVTLILSENVIRYQRASAIFIILLIILLLIVKLIQYALLPRARWGILIKTREKDTKFYSCCRWTITRVQGDSADTLTFENKTGNKTDPKIHHSAAASPTLSSSPYAYFPSEDKHDDDNY